MLTRPLLRFQQRGDRIRPVFPAQSRVVVDLADDLFDLAKNGIGESRASLEEAVNERILGFRPQKLAEGMQKILFDRLVFESPGPEAEALRARLFEEAQRIRSRLPEGAEVAAFERAMEAAFDRPFEALKTGLYADLPRQRPLTELRLKSGEALLDRYRLALVQGLLMYSPGLEVKLEDPPKPVFRRLMRWLRFCRLVVRVKPDGEGYRLSVIGPASVLEGSKRYGLQLAEFLAGLVRVPQFWLTAEIHLPKRPPATLEISHEDALQSPLSAADGHVPEAIQQTLAKLKIPGWKVILDAAPVPLGRDRLLVPDLVLAAESGKDRRVIELFHRWHRGPLLSRLQDLEATPRPDLRLGVDAHLWQDERLSEALSGHPQVFMFRSFPSARVLKALL